MQPSPDSPAGRRAVAVLSGTTLALAAALVYVLARGPSGAAPDLLDPEVRRAAVEELVERSVGIYDAHSDPDVAKVLQPNVEEREVDGALVSTNAYGLRERDFPLAKPAGVVRVVLLGDSFVMGYGGAAEDRLGVFLERWLEERSSAGLDVECLHVGVPSWNVLSEAAFLRRQLGVLRPDLVVHLVVKNDLNDTTGVRGFGAVGRFTPQHRERADGVVTKGSQPELWGYREGNALLHGLDFESRERWRSAGAEIGRLARAVEGYGGEYLLVAMINAFHPHVERWLGAELDGERQLAYLSDDFARDRRYWNSRSDSHWNRAGHELVAQVLYGLVVERGFLPVLGALEPWPEARAAMEEVHGEGLAEARSDALLRERLASIPIASELRFPVAEGESRAVSAQTYGGIGAEGFVSPYASLVLARGDAGRRLVLEGRRLGRLELAGGRARVYVDEVEVGEIALDGSGPFALEAELEGELATREHLSVRLRCDDWILDFDRTYRCLALRLERAAIVP